MFSYPLYEITCNDGTIFSGSKFNDAKRQVIEHYIDTDSYSFDGVKEVIFFDESGVTSDYKTDLQSLNTLIEEAITEARETNQIMFDAEVELEQEYHLNLL